MTDCPCPATALNTYYAPVMGLRHCSLGACEGQGAPLFTDGGFPPERLQRRGWRSGKVGPFPVKPIRKALGAYWFQSRSLASAQFKNQHLRRARPFSGNEVHYKLGQRKPDFAHKCSQTSTQGQRGFLMT